MNKYGKYFVAALVVLLSCSEGETRPYIEPTQVGPVEGVRVMWNYSSMQRLAEKGSYPRVKRLADNSLVAVYENANGYMRRSFDNGASWNEPEQLFTAFPFSTGTDNTTINISNMELIQLANGDLIAGCNYRPRKDGLYPFSIVIRRSTDNGASWLAPQILYKAGTEFGNGCWEPSFLQLPNGNVQIYFANEGPYRNNNDQEITVLESADNGATWDNGRMVCFREGRRDGMPVAVLSGNEIVLVIEDNKVDQFKPYIVRSSVDNSWAEPVLASSPKRYQAHKNPLPSSVYAGAPYLVRLPRGEFAISYQTTGGRAADWELSTMEIALSDSDGRNFEKLSRPFDVPLSREAKWGSLSVTDENTLCATVSSNFDNGALGIWMIDGKIMYDQLAGSTKTDPTLWVGSKSKALLSGSFYADGSKLHLAGTISAPDRNIRSFALYIDPKGRSLNGLGEGVLKLESSLNGSCTLSRFSGGEWQAVKDAVVSCTILQSFENLYTFDISLPQNMVEATSRVNVELKAVNFVEALIHSTTSASNGWIKLIIVN